MDGMQFLDALLKRSEGLIRAAYWSGYQDGLLVGAVGVLALVISALLIRGRR